ncbi:MAG TPA: helix-turn-helix transcriptional regulator [Herpetosiphonaceae bacterium]
MTHDVPTTTELINRLFETHLHPTEHRPYLPVEIVLKTEGVIQQSHLHRLRSGQIKNPTRETLLAFCRVFRVQPSYFFPELANETDLTSN